MKTVKLRGIEVEASMLRAEAVKRVLIANAAPAMLQLLTAILEEFDESDPVHSTFTGNFPKLMDDARAVIAKAKGRG